MTDLLVGRPAPGPAFDGPAADPRWRDEIDETLVCTAIVGVTHDVKSFRLQPARRRLYRFHPGQYLTLTVRVDGREISRCYTIASSPLQPDTLTITVKRVPGGPVSNWLHDHLRVGDTVPVTGPLGRFTTAEHPAHKYLFLSAGSGITPLMSMTRTIDGRGEPADVVFVHSARTPDDIIFRAELERIASRQHGIRVAAVCVEDSARERWTGFRGRLSLPMLRAIAPDLTDREVFACGPPPYMAAVRAMLTEAGAEPGRCHEETFTFPAAATAAAPPTAAPAAAAADTYSVRLSRSGRTVECEPGETVLEATARAGLSLPSSCGEGLCGTCKTTMLSGSVDMDHAGGIRPREIAQNKVLLCCSTPREDLVIDA